MVKLKWPYLSGSEFSSMRKSSKLGIKTGWGEDVGERIDLGFEKPGGTENERNMA